jgi:transcriptional regulator with XRE-family HTH domain
MQGTLGDYIKDKRAELGLNQTELAKRSNVPRETINRIENNKTMLPSADSRRRLAKALGVSHLDILIAAGEITPDEIQAVGAAGVILKQAEPAADALLKAAGSVNWSAAPELAHSLTTVMLGILKDQQAARSRRVAESAPAH